MPHLKYNKVLVLDPSPHQLSPSPSPILYLEVILFCNWRFIMSTYTLSTLIKHIGIRSKYIPVMAAVMSCVSMLSACLSFRLDLHSDCGELCLGNHLQSPGWLLRSWLHQHHLFRNGYFPPPFSEKIPSTRQIYLRPRVHL